MAISFSSVSRSDARARGAGVTAVLGPTNTGKTHLAIERMCGHSSGAIGFPLRLLAREVYDKVRAIKGERQVALITGEERIEPEGARYLLCTAEAMPRDGGGRAFRYGGEEFALLFTDMTLGQAVAALDAVRERLSQRSLVHQESGAPMGRVTFSAGVASAMGDGALTAADLALYAAKNRGKNQVARADT